MHGSVPLTTMPTDPVESMDVFITRESRVVEGAQTLAPGYCEDQALLESTAGQLSQPSETSNLYKTPLCLHVWFTVSSYIVSS